MSGVNAVVPLRWAAAMFGALPSEGDLRGRHKNKDCPKRGGGVNFGRAPLLRISVLNSRG